MTKFNTFIKGHFKILSIIATCLIMIAFVLVGIFTFFSPLKNNNDIYKKIQEEDKKIRDAKESSAQISITPKISATSKPLYETQYLSGNKVINIVLIKPKSLDSQTFIPIEKALRQTNTDTFSDCSKGACQPNASLNYISTYVKEQAARFGAANKYNLKINIHPVTLTANEPEKIGDIKDSWGKDPYSTTRLQDFFIDILRKNNLESLDKDNGVIFLYFDNSNTAGSNYSFFESKKFRSFAVPHQKRAFINVYKFNSYDSADFVEVTIHEMLHLFGANDKYVENTAEKGICIERGLAEPDKSPLYPQTFIEIMCGAAPLKKESSVDYKIGDLGKKEVIINKYTAQEIGW